MPKERLRNINFSVPKALKPGEEIVNGDIFWSCQNSIHTLFDYEIIDSEQKTKLQKSVIKKYGDLYPEMFPSVRGA